MKRSGSVITDPEARKLSNPDPKHYCTKLIVKFFKKFHLTVILSCLHYIFSSGQKIKSKTSESAFIINVNLIAF
jgi:hypothetical protein